MYNAAFIRDLRSKMTYALTPAGLVTFDPADKALEALPEGTCMLPGEADPRWLPERDTLLVDVIPVALNQSVELLANRWIQVFAASVPARWRNW